LKSTDNSLISSTKVFTIYNKKQAQKRKKFFKTLASAIPEGGDDVKLQYTNTGNFRKEFFLQFSILFYFFHQKRKKKQRWGKHFIIIIIIIIFHAKGEIMKKTYAIEKYTHTTHNW
jgi:hypothetical protein